MQTRSLRFIGVGAVLAALLCLAAMAFAQPSVRAASPAVSTTVTIGVDVNGNKSFNPCPAQSNPLEISAGTALTFKNTTNADVTVTFTFGKAGRTQTTTVPAGASVPIVPDFATEFTYTAAGINQTCFVAVSEALPSPTVPSSVPPTGGGPIPPTASGPHWGLWGVLLTTLALTGLGGTLLVRRRWLSR